MSLETIGALERGVRRAPYSDTVERLAQSLGLCADERLEFEAAARRARHNLPVPLTHLVGREDDVAVQQREGACTGGDPLIQLHVMFLEIGRIP